MSWGVRRIEDESTDPHYGGGRRSAMTVGEWLDSVSTQPHSRAGGSQPTYRAEPAHRSEPVPNTALETLDRKLEELNRRLKRLSDHPRPPARERRPDRDLRRSERDARREQEPDALAARLDQIDKRLSEIARAPRDGERSTLVQPKGDRSDRANRDAQSDAERLRQGLREIERLQATLLEGLNERNAKSTHILDRHLQEDRERSSRHASTVADMIARLEAEMRGLRQTVETRLEPSQPAFDDSELQDMRRMLHRIAEVSTSRQDTAQIDRLFQEMDRLRDLVVETGVRATAASSSKSAQESRLADMVERLASVATSAQEKTSEDMRTLDRRLADVADRMAELENRGANSGDLADLQHAINGIAAKLDRPAPKPVIPAGLIDLDIRIEKLSEKLDRHDPNPANSRQIASLESEIAGLRLDLAQTAGTRGTGRLEEQVSALADRIERLAGTTAASSAQKNSNLERFESRIGDLVDMLDRMVGSETTLDKHVDALQGEVASLRRDLSSLSIPASNPALENQMRLLAERLDKAGNQSTDPRVLAKIEEKISRLTDLVDAEQRKSPGTSGIEAKLGKLETLLTDRRDDALEAASLAAREAVREFASFAANTRQSDDGINAIEAELRQVQEATRTSDVRTSDALQSVHDALTAIVSRLGVIERTSTDRVGHDRAPVTPVQVEHGSQGYAADRGTSETLSPNRAAQPQMPIEAASAGPRTMQPPDLQPTLPPQMRAPEPPLSPEDHRPLEPGSGKPRIAPGPPGSATAGPTVTRAPQPQMPRSQPTPGYAPPAGPSPDGDAAGPKRNDFIAAARRAALAASQTGPGAPPIPNDRLRPEAFSDVAGEEPKAKKSLFGSLFKGRQKTMALAAVGIAAAATGVAFVASSVLHMPTADQMPTASIARPVATAPAQSAPTIEPGAAAVALAPPSSVTSTFAPATPTNEVNRQAALADAMKQAAAAQGYASSTGQKAADTTGSVRPPAPTSPTTQQMPAPIGTNLTDGPVSDATPAQSIGKAISQSPASGPWPMASDKIGSLALRTAAANGDPKAEFEVGMRYSEGRGLAQDMHEAATWFERAAAQNFEPAAYRLGSAYEKGLGVDRNVAEAKRWYRVAAEGGNIRAMHNLGVLYANERDMPSALPWFQKAADGGLKDSQFNLGIIHALGSGVKQDLAVSYKWFALGAAQGDQEAAKKRDDIATHLDHTQLAAAKMAVSTWRAMPISREANEETAVWAEPAASASAQPTTQAPPPPNGWTKIMQAQAALQGKGLYTGKIDGELTPETKAAIKAFQKRAGLRPSGEIDNSFLNAVVAKQM